MYKIPALDDAGKRVLTVIRNHGVAPGWQVLSEAAVSPAQLTATATSLVSMGLVSASGSFSSPSEVAKSYFNIQPSNIQLADLVLSQ